RIVNAALARIIALRFQGHQPVVVAHDGQPCDPRPPEGGRLVLGPAMRADVILDMVGTPGRSYAVTDDFYRGLAYTLLDLAYEPEKPGRQHPNPPPRLASNPVPEPDLTSAKRHEIALQGGMMGGMTMMRDMTGQAGGMMRGMGMMGQGGGMMRGMGMMGSSGAT